MGGRHRKKLTWPAQLQHLVEQYGAERVYFAGLDVLGYPPTLVHTKDEAKLVLRELEKTN